MWFFCFQLWFFSYFVEFSCSQVFSFIPCFMDALFKKISQRILIIVGALKKNLSSDSCICSFPSEPRFSVPALFLKAFQSSALNIWDLAFCKYLRLMYRKLVERSVCTDCTCQLVGFTTLFKCHLLSKALHITLLKNCTGILYTSFLFSL